VVAKIRERIAVNKKGPHKFEMERFNLKKLNEVEGKEKYCVEVSSRCTALEDLEIGLELNIEKTKYMLVSRDQNADQNRDIKIGNRSSEKVS
jgi:hypothetical protein